MDFPSLPTDSVYKFKAVAGLVIIAIAALSFAFVFDHGIKLMHEDAQAASRLLTRSLELTGRLAEPDEANRAQLVVIHAEMEQELLSRVVFRGPESGGVLQDSVGENFSFENKNDLVMAIESSPTSAG